MDRLESLRIFCRVVELNSFSRAANQLLMSNASITNHIAGLESHFGVRLLNRTTRRLSLTDDGRSCYERAQRLIAEMTELEDVLQGARLTPKGTLRVDIPTAVGRIYIAPALAKFVARYPDVSLRVHVTDRAIDIMEERADIAIWMGEVKDPNMVARLLYQSRSLCCASPSFLKEYGRPAHPQELVNFPCLGFIQPNTGQIVPWEFMKGEENISYTPQTSIAINHAESLIHAASTGAGIVQLLSSSLTPSIRAGQLEPILEEWTTAGPSISVVYPQNRHLSPKVRAFVDFMSEIFSDLPKNESPHTT
jgi:LysR family transcriptional regulator for bpeEF and oprC